MKERTAKEEFEDLTSQWDDENDEREVECTTCHDTGRIVAADGFHEYLGYDYLPCPHCSKGTSFPY